MLYKSKPVTSRAYDSAYATQACLLAFQAREDANGSCRGGQTCREVLFEVLDSLHEQLTTAR